MAKYKKKPVLPIYTIAIVWVIYTLVHPLYQVSDYVSVILISVVVFIVAKGVFPTIEDGPAIPPGAGPTRPRAGCGRADGGAGPGGTHRREQREGSADRAS